MVSIRNRRPSSSIPHSLDKTENFPSLEVAAGKKIIGIQDPGLYGMSYPGPRHGKHKTHCQPNGSFPIDLTGIYGFEPVIGLRSIDPFLRRTFDQKNSMSKCVLL